MAELEFNIARLQQCLDVTVGTPSVGDVVKVTSTSPLEFELGPGGGGTGTVDTVIGNDPISVDNTDPANPIITVVDADGGQSGVVTGSSQFFKGVKEFESLPISYPTPLDPEQLTNKKYVDTFAAGLQVKAAVRAATLVAGTLSSSFENGDIIDGVTLATGDRILIKNQASAIENGIYTVNASGAPTRATDYDAAGEANAGTFTTVTEGGQRNTQWVQVNIGIPTPGTDALNFSRLNISGNVNTIQSPNIAHGAGGTLTGAVTLDSTDIYYSGYSGNTVKQEMVTVTTAGNASPQVISGAKKFTGAVDLRGGLAIASTQALGTTSEQLATCNFVGTAVANSITGAASTIRTANLTVNRALISNALGKVAISPTTSAELAYVSGVTSSIQTQLNNKLNSTTAAATYAPIASPTFTGTPSAPTAITGTNTTQVATTAFVQDALVYSINTVKVSLTSAQIINSFNTPVQLIAAPGAGKAIQMLAVGMRLNYGTTPYVGTGISRITPSLNANGNIGTISQAGFIQATTSGIVQMSLGTGNLSSGSQIIENDSYVFRTLISAWSAGDSTIDFYLTYKIITL